MYKQSIMEYNGAAVLAMTGKNCVGICSDSRLGNNQAQTVATDFQKIFKMGEQLMVSLINYSQLLVKSGVMHYLYEVVCCA